MQVCVALESDTIEITYRWDRMEINVEDLRGCFTPKTTSWLRYYDNDSEVE